MIQDSRYSKHALVRSQSLFISVLSDLSLLRIIDGMGSRLPLLHSLSYASSPDLPLPTNTLPT
uniref:Uncharacterized protein n=1 Tax=Anguilla anguilla TaxID=7936 RepID=A0A0E9PC61_ANGAN